MPTRTPAAQRALEVAGALFYERGITATGVDLIAAESGVAKTTMYAHFGNKEALVAAYLHARGEAWRSHLRSEVAARAATPREQLLAIFDVLGEWMDGPDFRGCPFINAAAEYADPNHPVRRVVDAHRRWFRQTIQDLLDEINVPDSGRVADQLVMLRDGAMVSGYLSDPSAVADALRDACRAVIAFHAAS